MKKLAYTRPEDNGLTIIIPASKESIEQILGSLTDEEYEQQVINRAIPEGVDYVEIDDNDIPESREFRNAWKIQDNKIDFDLDKARDIQLERIRKAREPHLKELDTAYIVADEQEDDARKQEIKEAKQALRDITEPLKALEPESIEDIRAAFPQELLDKETT